MVAERAGVSRGTVDHVLNHRSRVKPETCQRVLEACAELGYLSPTERHKRLAAGNENEQRALTRLGVLLPDWTGNFHTGILRGIKKAQGELKQYNVHVHVEEYQSSNPDSIPTILNNMVEYGAQGIAICAVNHRSVEDEVDALVKKGIPVITFNSDLPDSERVSFVGQDYRKSGQIAAGIVSKCVSKDGLILAVCDNREFYRDIKRLEGFMDRIQELGFSAGQIEIIETYGNYHAANRKIAKALRKTPELSAIYMVNQNITGCCRALETAGKAETVRLIVHDLPENKRELLLNGYVDFTVSQDFFRQGYQPLICLRELLQLDRRPQASQTEHAFIISYGMEC